jgi:hypothetical protein
MGVNTRNSIVTNGLVLYMDAANSKSYVSGSTTWNDVSGNGNSGTLISGSGYSNQNGGSIVFDGVDDSVSIPYTIQTQFTNQISINAWINAQWFTTAINDGVTIISKNHTTLAVPYTVWFLIINPSGTYMGSVGNGTTRTLVTSAATLSLNTWYNLTFTYDGTTLKLYKNGIQDTNTSTATYTLGQNSVNPSIGSNPILAPYSDWFKGSIPIVQLYNRALSAQEVAQNYNATKTRFNLT